jgi:hypothetical protein
VADATGATVDNEAELVAASARFSCPLAISYLAVSVQDLMAADSKRSLRHFQCPLDSLLTVPRPLRRRVPRCPLPAPWHLPWPSASR